MRIYLNSVLTLLALLTLNIHTIALAEPLGLKTSMDSQKKYKVAKVLSADTILLDNDEKIRLIGLKAPKAPKPVDVERDEYGIVIEKVSLTKTLEERTFEFAKDLLEGKDVRLEFDVDKKDREFHTCAYVFLVEDNTFVNAEILRQGYSNLSLTPPNLKYQDELRAAYQEARKEHRGIHEDY